MTEKNLAEDKSRTVTLSAEIVDMLDAYAKAEGITRDLAARQLIRDGLEGMAAAGCLPPLKGKSKKLVDRVVRAGKQGIFGDQLLCAVYADEQDGGPLWAQKSLYRLISNANRRYLKAAGYQIKGEPAGHGAFGRYRLVKLEALA
jgi:hypothetical protein